MIEALEYVIYSNTPLHASAIWVKSLDATQVFFVLNMVVIRTCNLFSRWFLIPYQESTQPKT